MNFYDQLYNSIVRFHQLENELGITWMNENQLEQLCKLVGYKSFNLSWYDGPLLNLFDDEFSIGFSYGVGVLSIYKNMNTAMLPAVSVYFGRVNEHPDDPLPGEGYKECLIEMSNMKQPLAIPCENLHEKMLIRKLNTYFKNESTDNCIYIPRVFVENRNP